MQLFDPFEATRAAHRERPSNHIRCELVELMKTTPAMLDIFELEVIALELLAHGHVLHGPTIDHEERSLCPRTNRRSALKRGYRHALLPNADLGSHVLMKHEEQRFYHGGSNASKPTRERLYAYSIRCETMP